MQTCDGETLLAVFKSAAAEVMRRSHRRRVTVWFDQYTCAD